MQYRAGQKRERKTKSRSLKSVGIGLSRYAAAAKAHSLSMISGASGADTKKLGTNRKRFATCSWNEECSLALSTDGASKTTPIAGAVDTLRGFSRLDMTRSLHRRERYRTLSHRRLCRRR